MTAPFNFERTEAFAIARLMRSGLVGVELAKALHKDFPAILRDDVYLGAGAAMALSAADLALAEMELRLALRGVTVTK